MDTGLVRGSPCSIKVWRWETCRKMRIESKREREREIERETERDKRVRKYIIRIF